VLINVHPELVKVGDDDNLPINTCRFGDRDDAVDTVEYLLQPHYPEHINVRDSEELLPIHLAALGVNAKIVALLLSMILMEHQRRQKMKRSMYLLLHLACQHSALDTVKVLFDAYPQAIHECGEEDGETRFQ